MRARGRRLALLGLAAASVSACGSSGVPDPATALRPLVGGERQCATLLAGAWPIDLGAETLQRPGVNALIAAGLITREESRADPLAAPAAGIAIAPGGKQWIELRQLNPGGGQTPFLCYGKRELVDATPLSADGDAATYRYRVVDVPAWAKRDDIRAAFPFLDHALAGPIEASAPARLENGQWRLPEHSAWDGGATLDKVGFYPCSPADAEQPCG